MVLSRVILTISGEVQGVGYRSTVCQIAQEMGITGYVQNLPHNEVKILAEGDQAILYRFFKRIDIKQGGIFVKKINSRYFEPTGEFKDFRVML